MLKHLVPYGIKKVASIIVGIPRKLYLLLQAINPLTWVRLSQKHAQKKEESEDENSLEAKDYDPLRPSPPSENQYAAWHMEDAEREKLSAHIKIVQKLFIFLFVMIPILFAVAITKGWGSSVFSGTLLTFNFFILFFMIMVPTYLRLAVVRRQLELKRLITFKDLKQTQCWW